MCLVFLLPFLVLLRIESATEAKEEKCSSLEYAGLMLNLMVGMCCMMCLVRGLGCCEKFSGCSFFEIDIVSLSVEVEWFSLMSETK